MKFNQPSFVAVVGLLCSAVIGCQASTQGGSAMEPTTPVVSTATAMPMTNAASTTDPTAANSGAAVPAATATNPTVEPSSRVVPSKVTMQGVKLSLPGNLVFDTGKATLQNNAGNETVLEELRLFLEQRPKVTAIRIEGHTDNVGQAEDNLELSGKRALTVKTWLVSKGIAKERLLAVGFGAQKPVADNATENGRAQNRRTEFKVATWEGKDYLGRDPKGGGKVFE